MAKPEPKRHHLDRRANRIADEGERGHPNDLLTPRQVANWLDVTEAWLSIGRRENYGPRSTPSSNGTARYKRRDVVAWLRERARLYASASEYI